MVKEFNPYSVFSAQLLRLLDSCRKKKDPAWWLHKNGARTTLFMLESIARLVSKAHNDALSKKWYKNFKKLEDLMGEIDHYHELVMQFSAGRKLSKAQLAYLKKKRAKAVSKLNQDLKQKDFYKKFMIAFSKPGKINFNDKFFTKKLDQRIAEELNECFEFFNEYKKGFYSMEHQVHELRRKLRWVSIYAHSLQGMVVLQKPARRYKWEKEFVHKNTISSPFMRLPEKKGLKNYIRLNRTAFYALSYTIQELGYLKDKGLALETAARAIQKTSAVDKTRAGEMALQQTGSDFTIPQLLELAHDLLNRFFNVYGIHKALTKF